MKRFFCDAVTVLVLSALPAQPSFSRVIEQLPTVLITGQREVTTIDVMLPGNDIVRVVGETSMPYEFHDGEGPPQDEARKSKCVSDCGLQHSQQASFCTLSASRLQARLSLMPYLGAAGVTIAALWLFRDPVLALPTGAIGFTYISQSNANLVSQHLSTCNTLAANKYLDCVRNICHA